MEEYLPSSLDLFSQQPTLLSINETKYEKINTKTALDMGVQQLEWTAPADKMLYTDLNKSVFMIKYKYVKAGGTAIDDKLGIGPVNNPLTSMFSRVDLWINDQKVTPPETHMNYINFLHLFMQSQQAKDTYLTLSLYYEDTYNSTTTANQSNPAATENKNNGLVKRAGFFKSSKEVVLIGKFFIPPHCTNRLYLNNLKFDYQLQLAPMNFFSMSDADAGTYNYKITEAALLLCRVSVSPAIALAHTRLLQQKNAIYPMRAIMTRTMAIPVNSFSFHFENCFVGNLPVAIYIGFVKSEALHGNFKENPYVFYNLNVEEILCTMGTKKIPSVSYKLNFGQDQSQFALWNTYLASNYFSSNVGPGGLNRETLETGLFLFGLDLSNDHNTSAMYRNANFEAGNLTLEGQFSLATTEPYNSKLFFYIFKILFTQNINYYFYFLVMVFGIFAAQLEIDKFYQPMTFWG